VASEFGHGPYRRCGAETERLRRNVRELSDDPFTCVSPAVEGFVEQ
jgi:hypothetical protein